MNLLRKIRSVGRVAEPAPAPPALGPGVDGDLAARVRALRGSAQVRCVDAGSCNGCEIEIGQAFSPVYDAERYGARVVASPRHADVLLVTGPVTRNMAGPLRDTYAAASDPKIVVAVGDCAIDGGVFAGGYGVQGVVADVVPVDLHVPGCPPEPAAIVEALRKVTGR